MRTAPVRIHYDGGVARTRYDHEPLVTDDRPAIATALLALVRAYGADLYSDGFDEDGFEVVYYRHRERVPADVTRLVKANVRLVAAALTAESVRPERTRRPSRRIVRAAEARV